jgi:hypothetical protein
MGYNHASFWLSSLCNRLNNDYPSIVFAAACSNSDTDYTNLGQRMLENGAVGFVGATKVAYGRRGWSRPAHGSTQSLSFDFATAVTSLEYTQGAAHQYGLITNYQRNGWYYVKYEIAEWNLWGSPTLGLDLPISFDGVVTLNQNLHSVNDVLEITVRDGNINPELEAFVTILTASGDLEVLNLTPTDSGSVFEGKIYIAESQPVSGNNRLDVTHGDTITVYYIDADDGKGGMDVIKSAVSDVDGQKPVIDNIRFGRITSNSVEVIWETSKPATSSIHFGIDAMNRYETNQIPDTLHSVTLTELEPCTFYYFIIKATDAAGNHSVADNYGKYYRFNTSDSEVFYFEPLNTDPGWTAQHLWAFGQPTGEGGQYGHPNPTSGYTGQNVYGYNLFGDYENSSPPYNLTSKPIDCSNATDVTLQFRRWLNVDRNMNDKASVQVSVNGVNFHTVWENPDIETTDDEWIFQAFDISHIADNQPAVWLRWVMGETDGNRRYSGWNIDDITLTRSIQCGEPTPLPKATATPAPPNLPSTGIYLSMPTYQLTPGDEFDLVMRLRNGLATPLTVDVYLALELHGSFWFWPTWVNLDEGIAFVPDVTLPPASDYSASILQFTWPNVTGPVQGLFFYGLMMNSATMELAGDLGWVCWEFL